MSDVGNSEPLFGASFVGRYMLASDELELTDCWWGVSLVGLVALHFSSQPVVFEACRVFKFLMTLRVPTMLSL